MTSINQLRKDFETVRRALYPNPNQEYYRKRGEAITLLLREYSQQVEAEAAALTDEGAQELSKIVSKDPENIEEACQLRHLQNVLLEYQSWLFRKGWREE